MSNLNSSCLAEDDVAKLMKEVGVASEAENLKTMIKQIGDKSVQEHIVDGRTKMAAVAVAAGKSQLCLFYILISNTLSNL